MVTLGSNRPHRPSRGRRRSPPERVLAVCSPALEPFFSLPPRVLLLLVSSTSSVLRLPFLYNLFLLVRVRTTN
jgi:hypothetical protein